LKPGEQPENSSGKIFKVLSRDVKGRVETRQLLLSQDKSLALRFQKAEEASRVEKKLMKEKVLRLESMNYDEDVSLDDETFVPSFGTGIAYVQGGQSSSSPASSFV
jgi:hypothetical protein